MNETAKSPLEVAQDRGAALLDNTTVVGVTAALEDPRRATRADAQSLACVLEALVLHQSLTADTWGESEYYPPELWELKERAEGSGDARSIFTSFSHVSSTPQVAGAGTEDGLTVFTTGLVEDALDRLERALRPDGGLDQQHELVVERLGAGQSFSTLYREPRSLRAEIIDLLFGELPRGSEGVVLPERIQALEGKIGERLQGATEDLRLYAMFLLRAFYYEELASAFSLSYVPHSFRAEALLALKREGGGPATSRFHMYTSGLAAAARDELVKQLDKGITVNAPPIASWIAHDVNSRSELLPRALAVRASESARSFRRWVTEQEQILQQENKLTALKKAQEELTEIVAELGVEFLGDKRSGGHPITLKLGAGIPPVTGEVGTEVVLRSPTWLKRVLRHRRPYLTFFSRLTRELVNGDVVPFEKRLRQLPP